MAVKKMINMATVLDDSVDAVNVDTRMDTSEFTDEDVTAGVSAVSLDVTYVPVDTINIPEIRDVHGRLSDAVEALEDATGLSVIPFSMANIAPEVANLARHEIFTFNGERYAMSHRVRDTVISDFVEKIVHNLSTGLPYSEDIVTSVEYCDQRYRTFLLSRDEWSLLLSKFRNYKQSLTTDNVSSIILKVCAERV